MAVYGIYARCIGLYGSTWTVCALDIYCVPLRGLYMDCMGSKDRAHDNIGGNIEQYPAISGNIQPPLAMSRNIARHRRDNSGTYS